MFEFLRKEIVVLRKKNTKLKKELAEAESDKREIFNHASSVDHALALSKIRNEQMTKTNMSLLDDNNRRRKEINKLKNELKTQQQAHEGQLKDMRSEFEGALQNREAEVSNVSRNLHSSVVLHKREVEMIRHEADKKQQDHYSQIARLRDEIKNTQDSHQSYLSKLMNVLETTQESRRTVGDDRVKDAEIEGLKAEVARLTLSLNQKDTGSANNKSSTPWFTDKSARGSFSIGRLTTNATVGV
jgi:chromosome segregation ATPase